MERELQTLKGGAVYAARMILPEPVFGQINLPPCSSCLRGFRSVDPLDRLLALGRRA